MASLCFSCFCCCSFDWLIDWFLPLPRLHWTLISLRGRLEFGGYWHSMKALRKSTSFFSCQPRFWHWLSQPRSPAVNCFAPLVERDQRISWTVRKGEEWGRWGEQPTQSLEFRAHWLFVGLWGCVCFSPAPSLEVSLVFAPFLLGSWADACTSQPLRTTSSTQRPVPGSDMPHQRARAAKLRVQPSCPSFRGAWLVVTVPMAVHGVRGTCVTKSQHGGTAAWELAGHRLCTSKRKLLAFFFFNWFWFSVVKLF